MKKHLIKIIDNNWFFLSLVLFVSVLPFSQALVSIFAGILLQTALLEDNRGNKIKRIGENFIFLFLPGIYIIYLISAFLSNDISYSLYDLQKCLFFFVVPLAFVFGKSLNSRQKQFLFFLFVLSVFASTLIALLRWKLTKNTGTFAVHNASLVSHIRFSFQLILAFWFVIFVIQKNFRKASNLQLVILIAGAFYFLSFLLFQQSLTGIIAFTGSMTLYLGILVFKIHSKYKFCFIILFLFCILTPLFYLGNSIRNFYDIEKVDPAGIEQKTKQGNPYYHDFDNPLVENGRYVSLYVCEPEMREEWNKVSEIKYDSTGANGFPVKSTLVRYLTSKGLHKDAEGVKSLTRQDIMNIQNGVANVIYTKSKFSLYPRIYQTIWEYYVYTKTGDANLQSFSQRIEYARAALTIIKQNPVFGVGTGNWKEEFKKAYKTNSPNLQEDLYASAHNQYLNYLVKFGIFGFMAIFFLILFPVIKTKKYSDHLFLIFLVFMFFANFADSNFESHMGSSFFVLFYCIFMADGKNYFELSWQKQP